MSKYNRPRGTQDVYGQEAKKWQVIEEEIRQLAKKFNLDEMRMPIFEHTEVFNRENDSSDMVNKEMYTFQDNGGRSLTLQPEGTAGLIRAYVENKLYSDPEPLQKFYYICPVFRYERPQKGRLRIHHQFGVELIGQSSPLVDVQTILIGLSFLNEFGIEDVTIYLNTLGDDESREQYRQALKHHFEPVLDELCGDCHRRYQQNPLRLLDCKVDVDHPSMHSAPKMSDYLNEASKEYFETVKKLLDQFNIQYVIDDKLVRGLDYYSHTIFEIKPNRSDAAQSTLLAGGHYDHLVSQFGGPEVSSCGFGMGLERFILALEDEQIELVDEKEIDVYGISLSEKSSYKMLEIIQRLREVGFVCDLDTGNRSLKAQFKSADRSNARVILILGDDELEQGVINVKDSLNKTQTTVSFEDLETHVSETLLGDLLLNIETEMESLNE